MDKGEDKIETELIKFRDIALRSVLLEVLISPKPGSVDRFNSGIHKDMDIYTFMASASVLPKYFLDFLYAGYNNKTKEIFKELKNIGQEAEEISLKATGGVNTHKGIIFIFSLTLGALGYIKKHNINLSIDELLDTIKIISSQNIKNDLQKIKESSSRNENKTAGERLYLEYGIKGVRGSALDGFKKQLIPALDFFKNLRTNTNLSMNDIFANLFLYIITLTQDTNIIKKHGLDFYNQTSNLIKEKFEKGFIFNSQDKKSFQEYKDLEKIFMENNISAGGSADITALTIFFIYIFNLSEGI